MAEKTNNKETPQVSSWIKPALALSVVAGIVFPILNVKFGSTPVSLAAVTAVVNVALVLAMYAIFRNIRPRQIEGSLTGLLFSALVSLPVFIIAFIGLGFEITVLADIAAMYIAGVYIGSSEAAEKFLRTEE